MIFFIKPLIIFLFFTVIDPINLVIEGNGLVIDFAFKDASINMNWTLIKITRASALNDLPLSRKWLPNRLFCVKISTEKR